MIHDLLSQGSASSQPHLSVDAANRQVASAQDAHTPSSQTGNSPAAVLQPPATVPTTQWGREGRRLTRLSTALPEQRMATTEPHAWQSSAQALDFTQGWSMDRRLLDL